jgi:hypothetical protein
MALDQDTLVKYKLWLEQKRGKHVAIQFWDSKGHRMHISIVADPPDMSSVLKTATTFQVGNDPQLRRAQFELVIEAWEKSK